MSNDTLSSSAHRASRRLGVSAVAVALMSWLAPARADIIVVNGRLAAHASVSKTVAGPGVAPATAPDGAAPPAVTPAGPGGSECDTGTCRPTAEGEEGEGGQSPETMTVSLDDLDTVPDGWLCVPLGGGVELCAPEDDAETLKAFGPLPSDPDELAAATSGRGAVAGCAGGGVPPLGAGIALALLVLLAALRRR